jgi:steroid 5-alpha reductase family enzyme
VSTLAAWAQALPPILALAFIAWIVATARRNAGLVDIFWSLFFLAAALTWAALTAWTYRGALVVGLVVLWSLRLAGYLAWRNWNAPEDRRYQAIRARNQPGFEWKSLYLVFGLQGVLAWIIAAPLGVAIGSTQGPGIADALGAFLVLFGIGFEALADAQLARFKAQPANAGRVLDTGLWRYTRHPNYFGEFCVWWGFYALALGAGGAWTVFSPLLMSLLLLKVSGVALLERDIGERRPAYREYIARTNAFFPGPRRST